MGEFKSILAWQKADDLAVMVYDLTRRYFPKEELFGLTSQLRRAAVSVPANIAEGAGRKTLREFIQFLYTAKGSLNEVEYYLHLSRRLGYLTEEKYNEAEALRQETARTLQGFIRFKEKQLEEQQS